MKRRPRVQGWGGAFTWVLYTGSGLGVAKEPNPPPLPPSAAAAGTARPARQGRGPAVSVCSGPVCGAQRGAVPESLSVCGSPTQRAARAQVTGVNAGAGLPSTCTLACTPLMPSTCTPWMAPTFTPAPSCRSRPLCAGRHAGPLLRPARTATLAGTRRARWRWRGPRLSRPQDRDSGAASPESLRDAAEARCAPLTP